LLFPYEDCTICIIIQGSDYLYKAGNFASISVRSIDDSPSINKNLDFKGFRTNQYSSVIELSNRYNQIKKKPFIYDERLYAIAQLAKNNKYGIIDQDGNILPNFDFKYKSIALIENYEDKAQRWFYFEDKKGKKGFINTEGKTKLYGQLFSEVYGGGIYNVQKSKKKSGVLDLRTLEWVIKPQEKLKIEDEMISIRQKNRDYIYYVVVLEGEEKYLIDMQGKAYKPLARRSVLRYVELAAKLQLCNKTKFCKQRNEV